MLFNFWFVGFGMFVEVLLFVEVFVGILGSFGGFGGFGSLVVLVFFGFFGFFMVFMVLFVFCGFCGFWMFSLEGKFSYELWLLLVWFLIL